MQPDAQRLALEYLISGCVLIPTQVVIKNGKPAIIPIIKWQQEQSKLIRHNNDALRYWPDDPKVTYGISIHCELSRIIAIDFDTKKDAYHTAKLRPEVIEVLQRHGHTAETPDELRLLLMAQLPKPRIHRTKSNGYHFIYSFDHSKKYKDMPGLEIKHLQDDLAPAIDTLGKGSALTMPPTTMPDGRAYTVETADNGVYGYTPTKAPIWLIEALYATAQMRQALKPAIHLDAIPNTGDLTRHEYWLQRYIGEASTNGRNQSGFKLAQQLRDDGLTQDSAWPIMQRYFDAIQHIGNDPYTIDELQASINSVYGKPARQPAPTNGTKKAPETPKRRKDTPMPTNTPEAQPEAPETIIEAPAVDLRSILRTASQIAKAIDDGEEKEQRPIVYTPAGDPWLTAGAYIVAGRPKSMKSWLTLHIANAVAHGNHLFGNSAWRVTKGASLYLDFEMPTPEADKRLSMMNVAEELQYLTQSKWRAVIDAQPMAEQTDLAMTLIKIWYENLPDDTKPGVIVVDTISAILPDTYAKNADVSTADYRYYKQWDNLAIDLDACIILVAHLTKGYGQRGHPTDAIYGSGKIQGAIQGTIAIEANNDDADTPGITLWPKVRQVHLHSLPLQFDKDAGHHIIANAKQVNRTDWGLIRNAIYQALANAEQMTTQEIIEAIASDTIKPGSIRTNLTRMVKDGDIDAIGRATYRQRQR